jgi:hypothetical protein
MLIQTPPHKLSHTLNKDLLNKSLPHSSSEANRPELLYQKNKNKNQQLAAK